MTVSMTGSGSLGVRLGHLGGIVGVGTTLGNPDLNYYRGTIMPNKIGQVETDFAASPEFRSVVDGLYSQLEGWKGSQAGFLQYVARVAADIVIKTVNADVPLSSLDIVTALKVMISQMNTGGYYFNPSSVAAGSQTAVGSPNGTPKFVMSTKDPNGLALQYAFAETLSFKVTGDSQLYATLNNEPFSVTGVLPQGDPLSQLWPAGSGCNVAANLADATSDSSGSSLGFGNALVNSDFETFTVANQADNWVYNVGAAGTDIFSSATAYTGTKSLQFTGDGSQLTNASQTFNDDTGTAYPLLPLTQYAYGGWVYAATAPAAGVLTFDLYNGTSVINDAAAVANSFTRDLTTLTNATWTYVSGVFRTPALLPAAIYLRHRLSTAMTSPRTVLMDHFCLTPMFETYPGGLWCAGFSGATKVLTNDTWTIAVTNIWGLFQRLLEKLFQMRQNRLVGPFTGSILVPESYIE